MSTVTLPPKVQTRPTARLVPYAQNPRLHDDDQIKQIAESIRKFGFNNPVLIDPDDEIIAGHGRVLAAELLGLPKCPVVVLPHLNEAQKRAYRIADNQIALNSSWSVNFLTSELASLKLENFELDVLGFDPRTLRSLLDEAGSNRENPYSSKIESPIYEPSGKQPEISELFDPTRAYQLIADIDASRLPAELKDFLRLAAYRHVVFNYEKIADYYAHSSQWVQNLMENSALVVIDFDKAIELGFVTMTKDLAAIHTATVNPLEVDNPDEE